MTEQAADSRAPLAIPALVTLAVAGVFFFGLAPGASRFTLLGGLAAVYGAATIAGVMRLRQRSQLSLLRPRSGDITFGALPAFLLYGLVFVVHALVTAPGNPQEGWILRVYLLLGDPFSDTRHLLAAGVALIGALEEFTWRGFLTPMLEERVGPLKGSAATTLLWALSHAPTVWLLADPVAGPNPLLVLAALGCGSVWAYFRWRMERLVPVLISHALFSWAIVEFPLWTPIFGR